MPNQIPIDPKLPKMFDGTPNEHRSKAELDAWWDHPYCVTHPDGGYIVYCLNGGAWDRPTAFGRAATYQEACELAERRQAEWVITRRQPIFQYSVEPPFVVICLEQRPDHQPTVLGSFDTMDEVNALYGK